MSQSLHSSLSLGNLPLGKREDGEGLESCEKNYEEYMPVELSAVDSMLKDTITELQKALFESRRLLSERDREITSLRREFEQTRGSADESRSSVIEEEFKKSQMKVIDLEKSVLKLHQDISAQRMQPESANNDPETTGNAGGGHMCYCGSICLAMKEVVDLKRRLHQTEQKYSQLKRNMRSRERNRVKVGVAHRDSPCTVS